MSESIRSVSPRRSLFRERRDTIFWYGAERHSMPTQKELRAQRLQGEDDLVTCLDNQLYLDAAVSCGLYPALMRPIEQEAFPLVYRDKAMWQSYFDIRNKICLNWIDNPLSFLSLEEILEDFNEHNVTAVEIVYDFLNVFGFINTGPLSGRPDKIQLEKSVIVIGAGISGLVCAQQLKNLGYDVQVVEARDRIGGRIHSLSFQHDGIGCAVDLGASIVTGIVGNPLALLCKQLNIEMHTIDTECPLYQSNGEIVPELDDSRAEKAWHRILEGTDKLRKNAEKDSSLGEAIQMINEKIVRFVGENEKGLLKWHIANLEYGCATSLNNVSLLNWDQDDSFDFAGDHCFLKSGFGALVDHLSKEIQVKLNEFVSSIRYTGESVFVSTSSNSSYSGDVVVVSLPLGVLKEGRIKFVPELPLDKLQSIRKLGYGLINKVILTFENPFWKDTVASDMFGIVKDGSSEEDWSKFFLFWNMYNTTGAPVLVSIIAAKAAVNSEALTNEQLSEEALSTLRSVFPEISNPSRVEVTRWGSDDFSRGSYSYVAKGSSGADYKVLKGNVDGKLFFIGEATNAENPASASGAYTSGLREAGWIHRRLSSECLKYDLHLHLSRQKSLETSEVKQDQVEVDIPSAFRSQSPSRLAYKSQLQDMLKKALDGDLEDINPAFVHSVPAYHTGVNEESSSPIETDSSESIDSTQESISSPPLQMPSLSSFASVSKQKRRSSPDSKHKTKRPKLESKSTKVVSKSSADSNEFKVLVDIVSPCIKKMLREWPNKLNASTFKVVYKRTIGHVCKMWKKKNCPKPKKFWHERRQAKVSALMEKYVNETSQTGQ